MIGFCNAIPETEDHFYKYISAIWSKCHVCFSNNNTVYSSTHLVQKVQAGLMDSWKNVASFLSARMSTGTSNFFYKCMNPFQASIHLRLNFITLVTYTARNTGMLTIFTLCTIYDFCSFSLSVFS